MKAATVLLIFMFLIGCAPTHYRNFRHPDYGQVEFKRDFHECARVNRVHAQYSKYAYGVFSGSVDNGQVYREVDYGGFRQCLADLGWRPVAERTPPLKTN